MPLDPMHTFYNALKSYPSFVEEDWAEMKKESRIRHFKAGEHYISAGEKAKDIAFIVKGLFRLYHLDYEGKEFNRGFAMEPHFFGANSSLFFDEECLFYIQAVQDTTAIVFNPIPFLDRTLFKDAMIAGLFEVHRVKERREAGLLMDDAETRYLNFLKDMPKVAARLTDIHIASYIGVSPVHLSRIKKKLKL